MTFNEYLNQAWKNHGAQSEDVATSLTEGLTLCQSPEDLTSLTHLATHIYAEHLRRFSEGAERLRSFRDSPFATSTSSEFTIARAVAAMQLADGTVDENDRLGLTPSDLARSLGTAATAIVTQDSVRSEKFLRSALNIIATLDFSSLEDEGKSLARAIAAATHNIAAHFEEMKEFTAQQQTLMLLAVEASRRYWEIAGTWLEVERAEHQLAKCLLRAGHFEEARKHADLCLEICRQNSAAALEFFFAFEAIANIEKAVASEKFNEAVRAATEWFEKMSPDDQSWAQASLAALR